MTGPKLLATRTLPRDWRDDARCRIGICLGCDVMEECLADAIATGERHAVRGGRRFGLATRDDS